MNYPHVRQIHYYGLLKSSGAKWLIEGDLMPRTDMTNHVM